MRELYSLLLLLKTYYMKRILYFYIIIPVTIFACSCNGDVVKRKADDVKRKATVEAPDSTIVVSVSRIKDDTLYAKSIETGREYKYFYTEAIKNKKIHGKLTVEDILAITANHKLHELTKAINLSNLLGLWMIEGKDCEGFRFCNNGTISPVNMSNLLFKEWDIYNGDLYITYNNETPSKNTKEKVRINILDENNLNITINDADLICKKHGLITID